MKEDEIFTKHNVPVVNSYCSDIEISNKRILKAVKWEKIDTYKVFENSQHEKA